MSGLLEPLRDLTDRGQIDVPDVSQMYTRPDDWQSERKKNRGNECP